MVEFNNYETGYVACQLLKLKPKVKILLNK